MRRLCLFVLVLFLGVGCAGMSDPKQWEEFWSEVRGDNMKLKMGEGSEGLPKGELNY
jgi:hypothetical protein